jgi:hypothetical protein
LPDLYHEIGHLIDKQHSSDFRDKFIPILDNFYRSEELRVVDEQRDPKLIAFYRDKHTRWLNGWIMEFTCDFIATYLVGPAYAYTNLKLSTLSSGKDRIYADFPSHPSDEARMRGIFYLLQQLGYDKEMQEVDTLWKEFLKNINNPVPANYSFIFPQTLIESLCQCVLSGCQAIDLRSYPEQLKSFDSPISKILNEAWREALKYPIDYPNWEAANISLIGTVI